MKGTGKSLGAAHLFRIAKTAYERLQGKAPTSGGKDDALISIVFSVASIEAFFNELPKMLSSFTELLKQESSEVSTFVRLAEEIETTNNSITVKYAIAYCVLSGQSCDKRGHPYQHLALLIEARNRLLHMKPNDFSVEARRVEHQWNRIGNLLKSFVR